MRTSLWLIVGLVLLAVAAFPVTPVRPSFGPGY